LRRRSSNKIETGVEGTLIKLKLEEKELRSLLCVEQQSTVLSDTWSRRDSNKIDSGEEGTVIKLRLEKKELQ